MWWRILGGLLIVIVLAAMGFLWCVWSYAFTPHGVGGESGTEISVYLPPGSGVRGIRALLAEHGVLADDSRFFVLARLMGMAHRLQAGEYRIRSGQTPYEIIRLLAAGLTAHRTVTIPEGATVYDVARRIADEKLAAEDEILALARDREFLERLGLTADSLEGYLYPDTYQFSKGREDAARILGRMVAHSREMRLQIEGEAKELAPGLDWHQVLTIASIVEKETAQDSERPLIARVFLERLRLGMPLQADPTVTYGLGLFGQRLSRKDLQTPSPYNTYVTKGLPPGPIANPGRAAIISVLKPSDETYLYFVSKNDGSHQFSKNLTEHNKAVRQYQR